MTYGDRGDRDNGLIYDPTINLVIFQFYSPDSSASVKFFEQHCFEQSFISSFFMMLKCIENSSPRYSPKRVPRQNVKKMSSLLHTLKLFEKPNKKYLQ